MKLQEALRALLEGKKIRMSKWPIDDFVYIKNDKIYSNLGEEFAVLFGLSDTIWELYEPKGENFAWACEQLLKGKKVTRKSWKSQDAYISASDKNNDLIFFSKFTTMQYFIVKQDMEATDWVLYNA